VADALGADVDGGGGGADGGAQTVLPAGEAGPAVGVRA
jgi:hypothetical protein